MVKCEAIYNSQGSNSLFNLVCFFNILGLIMDKACACLYSLLAVLISTVDPSQGSAWSYSGPMGPSNWGKTVEGASACLGHKQSPININTAETREKSFPPFELSGYDLDQSLHPVPHPLTMVNNGHTVQVNLGGPYQVSGGGLPHPYTAVQFHLHWGSKNNKGSEHTVDNRAYPAEMHIVHYDSTTYGHVLDAIAEPEGLAVLGFFIKIGSHNYAWDPVINHIASVRDETTPYRFPDAFALQLLIPKDLSRFYRYNGSLTTPGCYESVIWTVFQNPIVLSYAQISQLRRVFNPDTHTAPDSTGHGPAGLLEKISDNFRPVQRLWFREVYQSWPRVRAVDEQPSWYNHFLGKNMGEMNQRSKGGPVETTAIEDNGYGAYIGNGDAMQWLWQKLRHGDYADHQDLEYYDYTYDAGGMMDDEVDIEDTIHDPEQAPQDDPHHDDPEVEPHEVAVNKDPHSAKGPKSAADAQSAHMPAAEVDGQAQSGGHQESENVVPQGTSNGHNEGHTANKNVPHENQNVPHDTNSGPNENTASGPDNAQPQNEHIPQTQHVTEPHGTTARPPVVPHGTTARPPVVPHGTAQQV